MAHALVTEHSGQVPADMDALTKLPGVGRKTANVVLGHALGVPGLPVDRHVLRVSNRIGIAEGDDPVKVEAQICGALPEEMWTLASDVQILHGRRICRPKPMCPDCLVRDDCDYYEHVVTKEADRASKPKKTKAKRKAVTRAAFERLLVEAVALIPKRFRREIKNLALVVEDEPSLELLDEMEIEPPDSLYGLYQGTPLTERTWQYGNQLPDRITLFQRPIEEDCDDEDDVRAVIGETLIHEVGHYFGMSEEEIEDIEERYWRGETLVEDED